MKGLSRHESDRQRERGSLLFALILTGVILLVVFFGGLITNSLALLSDAGHMFTDLAALLMSFIALSLALRPATANRTYGLHRLEILVALANGVSLVFICFLIFREAYHRFLSPEPVQSLGMLLIATIGLGANAISALVLRSGESLNVQSAFLHVLGDALSSLGVILGGLIMIFTSWYWVDPLISLLISIIILASGYRLIKEAVNILLEATPEGIDLESVVAAIKKISGVKDVHDIHIWTITSHIYALSAHLLIDDQLTSKSTEIVQCVNQLLAQQFHIHHATLQCECQACGRQEVLFCDLKEGGEKT